MFTSRRIAKAIRKNAKAVVLVSIVCALVSCSSPISAQKIPFRPNKSQSMERMYTRMMADRLDRELNLMKVSMQLDGEQVEQLRAAGKEPIVSLAKELSLKVWDNGKQGVFDTNALPPSVLTAVLEAANEVAGAENVEAFEENQKSRRAFKKKAGIDGFLTTIDQALCLSVEQTEQFRKTLNTHWKGEWAYFGMMSDQSGLLILRKQIEQLPAEELQAFLRPSQIKALSGPDPAPFRTLMATADAKNREQQTKDYESGQRIHGESIANLKIEALQTLFSLDTHKIELLNSAAKKAVDRVVAEQKLAFLKLAEKGPANLDPKSADLLALHVFDHIDSRPEWQRAITDVLDRKQQKQRKAREAARNQLRTVSSFGSMVAGLSERFAFTANQEKAMMELLLVRAQSNKNAGGYRTLLTIPDAKLQLIVDEGQWPRFKTTLTAMRNQLRLNPDS